MYEWRKGKENKTSSFEDFAFLFRMQSLPVILSQNSDIWAPISARVAGKVSVLIWGLFMVEIGKGEVN